MRFINLTILATVAVVFSACGGGGSSSGASGNCVDVDRPPVGTTYSVLDGSKISGPNFSGEFRYRLKSRTSTQEVWSQESEVQANGFSGLTEEIETTRYITRSGNYYIESKEVSVADPKLNGQSLGGSTITTTTTYSPALKIPAKYCVGDVLKSSVNVNEVTVVNPPLPAPYSAFFPSNETKNYSEVAEGKVIAINKSITTPAGTFKTVYLDSKGVSEGVEMRMKSYIDQDTGLMVKMELYDASGAKVGTMELQTLTKP